MSKDLARDTTTFDKGSAPSLVESFGIVGLHDYRNIFLSSPFAATILIAQNGSGKTTLLGALDAFLRGQFSRLRDLQFKEIRCKLRNLPGELVLRREDLHRILEVAVDSEIARFARRYDLSPGSCSIFLQEEYDRLRDNYRLLSEEPIYDAIAKTVGYRHSDVVGVLDKALSMTQAKGANTQELRSTIRSGIGDIDLVYLPTYRRIELPLSDNEEGSSRRRPRYRFGSSKLFPGDIQFGLGDISERLAELNQEILVDSNKGYRQISADIINELIDGTLERENYDTSAIPRREDLVLFFSRLKEGRKVGPFFSSFGEISAPNLDKIYVSGEIPTESNKFLRYFLGKLNSVISATRDIELPVEDFILNCNRYLSSEDTSTAVRSEGSSVEREIGIDDKTLRLDRKSLKVFAQSVASGRKISLEALSSGEKQMVSLFAKLFLYPKRKLILIDEPELSLSLDWQRLILADVIRAPLCQQVIAITHSPFVFENALEPFARSLHLSIDPGGSTPDDLDKTEGPSD